MNKNQDGMERQYWFLLEPYVHISIKKGSLLLYNLLSGKALEYTKNCNQKILNLVKKLESPNNLRVITLKEKALHNPIISQFVDKVREYFMGDLIDTCFSDGKPVQMMPIVAIRKNIDYLKKNHRHSVGENILEYLSEIFLYINNTCDQNCPVCRHAYKQFPFCTINSRKKSELDITNIKELLGKITNTSLVNLNILGGNIFRYSKFKELTELINHLPTRKIYYTHYLNIIEKSSTLKFINPRSSSLKILVPSPLIEEKLKAALEISMNNRIASRFVFIIQSEEEFEKSENLISSLQIIDHEFLPFFNGNNLDFFMKGVFMEKEEIFETKPKMKDVYAYSVLNSLNFGRITILSNGHIYANVNNSRLGVMGKDSIHDALYTEMYHGKSWLKSRKNVEPCKHCTLQALCPPLSNYTYAIGKNNLCHVIS